MSFLLPVKFFEHLRMKRRKKTLRTTAVYSKHVEKEINASVINVLTMRL